MGTRTSTRQDGECGKAGKIIIFTSSDNFCAPSNYLLHLEISCKFWSLLNICRLEKHAYLSLMEIGWRQPAAASSNTCYPANTYQFWAGTSEHCFIRIQYVHVCLQFSLGEGIANPPLKVTTLSGTNICRAIGICPPSAECWTPSRGRPQTAIQALQFL